MKQDLVALFPGQGSQYIGMGRELFEKNPFPMQPELIRIVYTDPSAEKLQLTENAQPAIGALSAAMWHLLQENGFTPSFAAGHSFGELTALFAAGVLTEQSFQRLAEARGRAMANPADAGSMLAVIGAVQNLEEAIKPWPALKVANWNAPDQAVIAGSKADLAEAKIKLKEQGFATIPLPVAAAFHTPLVAHAQKPFAEAVAKETFHQAKLAVYSNVTANPYPTDPAAMQALLQKQMLSSVLFVQEIENIYAAGGRCFVEVGPKGVLTNLVGKILKGRPHTAIALNPSSGKDSQEQFDQAIAALKALY